MAKTLEAHEQPINKVFSDDYVFHIPDYQRPYSWTGEQAGELIEDLLSFIKANPVSVADMPAYFLGSIVLIKGNSADAGVVDGQQRLTTLTILLAAIRASAEVGLQAEFTKRIYKSKDALTGADERFLLTLRKRDAEFFQKYIQREDGFPKLLELQTELVDSHRNLRDNALLFHARLQKMSPEERMILAQFILQRCYLVVVSTPDENSAFRIFAVLNSRGLDLSATDILKARMIGGIVEGQRNDYTQKWEDIEEDLGRDDFNTLFAHIRTVFRKVKAQETLLKEFEDYVPDMKRPSYFIDDVLRPMSQAYADISASSYSAPTHAEKVNAHLRWLNRLEFNDWVPPILSFLARFRESPVKVAEFVADMERLSYFMLVTKQGVSRRIDRFAKVLSAIESDQNLTADDSALQLTPSEQDEFYTRLNGPIYDDLSAKARTPLLLRLDSLISGGGATYDYQVISVEHVLPQNPKPDSEWLTLFPDPEQRLTLVHRFGNLVLLTRKKNSAASNWDFDRKKVSYFQKGGVSPFPLTTQVIGVDKWTPDIVEKRQAELMSVLESHWRLEERMSSLEYLLG